LKKLLILHNRYTPDDTDIWREAVRGGWKIERPNLFNVSELSLGYDTVRYYGNTLHQEQIKDSIPVYFSRINLNCLPNLLSYTKRLIKLYTFGDLNGYVPFTAFYKPVNNKWFEAGVYNKGSSISGSSKADDMIYISEIMRFTHEVRCFVIDGKIQTSSLYRIDGNVWDKTDLKPEKINFDDRIDDTPIPGMVKAIHKKCGTELPSGIVMDFGYNSDREWALIEFNEAWASGLYYCDVSKAFNTIIKSQIDNKEIAKLID